MGILEITYSISWEYLWKFGVLLYFGAWRAPMQSMKMGSWVAGGEELAVSRKDQNIADVTGFLPRNSPTHWRSRRKVRHTVSWFWWWWHAPSANNDDPWSWTMNPWSSAIITSLIVIVMSMEKSKLGAVAWLHGWWSLCGSVWRAPARAMPVEKNICEIIDRHVILLYAYYVSINADRDID